MRKISYLALSFFISLNTYCQGTARYFYIKCLPKSANNKLFQVKSINDSIGIIIDNKWYRISKSKNKSQSILCRTNNGNRNTIDVYADIIDTRFKLILTPSQKDSFMKNTKYYHQSYNLHNSHSSHYSSFHHSHASHYSSRF